MDVLQTNVNFEQTRLWQKKGGIMDTLFFLNMNMEEEYDFNHLEISVVLSFFWHLVSVLSFVCLMKSDVVHI